MNTQVQQDNAQPLSEQAIQSNPSQPALQSPQNLTFVDKKRYGWLLGPLIPVLGMAAITVYNAYPQKSKWLLPFGPALLHGIIPLLDKLVGEDPNNPPQTAFAQLENDPFYEKVLATFVPLQILNTIYAAWTVSKQVKLGNANLVDQILAGVSIGYINGIAVTIAHEYSHKHNTYSHFMSQVSLLPIAYNHFRVEHVYGHHKRVATPEDPASSQMGESFYQFWPRTVIGSFKSAVDIQHRRLERMGKSFFSAKNELLWGWAGTALFHGAIIAAFGVRILPFWLTQTFVGISLFELINYVEHYGLMRQKRENGQYERTLPEHSWNSNRLLTNLFLYQLQRHSDHHAYPTRVYQCLRSFDEAPQLPTGYAGILIPALVPQWWFNMMDKRVFAHYKGDLSLANIHPKAKAKIYKKFGLQGQLNNKAA